MKCPNCGEEITNQNKCDKCGTTVILKNEEGESNGFKAAQNNGGSSKRANPFLFIILAIVLIVAIFAVYFVHNLNNPRYIFDKIINQYLSSEEENLDFETVKVNADLELSIDGEENNAITEFLNNAKFSFSTELDKEKQEEIIGVKMVKSDEELINANMKLEAESQKLYVNLGEFFEKTIQLDLSEISEEAFEIADTGIMSLSQEINRKKAQEIMKKEIKSQLKDEYFSSEKVTIDDENMTKNKLRLTVEEFTDIIKNIANNLAENEEFIGCFEDGEKIKESLKESVNEIEELDIEDEDENAYIEIDIYTKGILKNVKKVDFLLEQEDEKATIEVKKLNDEEYEYKVFDNEEQVLEGTLKVKADDDQFELELSTKIDETTITAKVFTKTVYNEELSDFDEKDTVKAEELNEEDIEALYSNFMQSRLFEEITSLAESLFAVGNQGTLESTYDLEDNNDYDLDEYDLEMEDFDWMEN